MEKSVEKSEEQAVIIKMITVPIIMLDVEYCKEIASDIIHQADRQQTLAVLNPGHPPIKNDILAKQGHALKKLCEYVDLLKEVEQLKAKLKDEQNTRDDIMKMFI